MIELLKDLDYRPNIDTIDEPDNLKNGS